MTNTLTHHTNGRLSAPIRNRYFYGKLLDVHHLEMEQQYFLEMGRLVNRLTLGSGVLCGLRVRLGDDDGTVVVSPGVAVDGAGREIVVTEPVTLDLASLDLEDEADRRIGHAEMEVDAEAERHPELAVGSHETETVPTRGGKVLCICYHECDVEPAPVLVADCDLREDCIPGAVRERFKFTLMPATADILPEDPCSILRGTAPRGPQTTEDHSHELERAVSAHLNYELGTTGTNPRFPGSTGLRQRLCAVFHPPCGPGPDCVPIALIGKGRDGILVDECLPRRTIYSNAVLLDLILCLAERIDECCGRTVTVTAPKVVDLWPPPPARPADPADDATPTEVKLAEFNTHLNLPEGGITVSFDRAMNQERLEQPDEWLRVMVLPETDGAQARGFTLHLELVGTSGDGDGQTATYRFAGTQGQLGEVEGAAGLPELLTKLNVNKAWVLVLMRSDDVTQIAAADDAELLDGDFAGTRLTSEICDLLWNVSVFAATLAPGLRTMIAAPPKPMPALPSGNGIEGGVFHSSFHITG